MKIAVIGSRDFSNGPLLDAVLCEYRDQCATVVSGGARGADIMGERWARKNGIETLIFLPDHKRFKHPYHVRNRKIVEHADMVVAFWNGRSSGTRYTIDYARRRGVPVRIVRPEERTRA